jgi:hypothetical protein
MNGLQRFPMILKVRPGLMGRGHPLAKWLTASLPVPHLDLQYSLK